MLVSAVDLSSRHNPHQVTEGGQHGNIQFISFKDLYLCSSSRSATPPFEEKALVLRGLFLSFRL